MTKIYSLTFTIISYFMFIIIFTMIMNSLNMNMMIVLMVTYSMLIFITMSMWSKNYMYSIIMFLTLISGLLIIFLYFTSLVSNMKNNFYLNNLITVTFTMNVLMIMTMNHNNQTNMNNNSMKIPYYSYMDLYSSSMNNSNILINLNEKMFSNLFTMYMYPHSNITFMCMMFLLLAMFSIIKICLYKSTTMRKINK